MDLLYLAHCVPNPPNKGEKIRSYHQVHHLARHHNVHLVCFARQDSEIEEAHQLSGICSSVYARKVHGVKGLLRGACGLALGGCLNEAFYRSAAMKRYVQTLIAKYPIDMTFAYSAVMHPYAPARIPVLLDMIDVDSEKWFDYSLTRKPNMLYRLEAKRLRAFERRCVEASAKTILTTAHEESVLRGFVPDASTGYMENGIDGGYFDGMARPIPGSDSNREFVAFVGSMDYHPNIEAALWFAREVFPAIRQRRPNLEFFVIGRNPPASVLALHGKDGVVVTGGVPDIRPYLSAAQAIVTPLFLARGIQNKVLEALAMGRRVLASDLVCRTFGTDVPPGVIRCADAASFVEGVLRECAESREMNAGIREAACNRFSWSRNLDRLEDTMMSLVHREPARL